MSDDPTRGRLAIGQPCTGCYQGTREDRGGKRRKCGLCHGTGTRYVASDEPAISVAAHEAALSLAVGDLVHVDEATDAEMEVAYLRDTPTISVAAVLAIIDGYEWAHDPDLSENSLSKRDTYTNEGRVSACAAIRVAIEGTET